VHDSYHEIKVRYHNENPWFKRAIDRLTLDATCNQQVALWRIQKQKNMGTAKISVLQTVKLNRFVELMEKKMRKNMMQGFYKIDAGKNINLNESMYMNQSFVQNPRTSKLDQSKFVKTL
jgi:hypothetical protein